MHTRPVLDDDRRQVVDPVTGLNTFELNVPDLILLPTAVADDGTFSGAVEISGPVSVGSYAGILSGAQSKAIAGGIKVEDHFGDETGGEEEYGNFILGQCGTSASNDPALCAACATE
ncbi:MAG: hypothetical protein ACI9PU_001516 [Ascidiaceihabitans sp.]